MENKHKYQLKISLNVLEALGANLYSSMPAVVSEAVANSWDADANIVRIDLDTEKCIVTIEDDGCGMSLDDINDKYLLVGYHKRGDHEQNDKKEEYRTPGKRLPMGRKGIGKLSLFSMAKLVQVETVKVNEKGIVEKNGFIMDSDKIKDLAKNSGDENALTTYPPEDIPHEKITFNPNAGHGTRITLRNLKMEISKTRVHLCKRLARRFTIIGPKEKFEVFVDGTQIKPEDRDYFNKLEYLWYVKSEAAEMSQEPGAIDKKDIEEAKVQQNEYTKHCGKLKRSKGLENARYVDDSKQFEISGWVGSVEEHKDLEEGNNSIVVFAKGKLFHEDILSDLKEGGMFSKYIIGEIHADFLDRDYLPDMATTGRQLAKDEERFELLKEHIKQKIVKPIGRVWEDWRKEDAVADAEKEEPKIKDWFNSLKDTSKPVAEKLFQQIKEIRVPNREIKRQLYRNAIVAFETLEFKGRLKSLENIKSGEGVEVLVEAFKNIGDIEAVHYYDITESRLEVIKKFAGLTKLDEKEKVLQEYLFKRLWLIDASWDPATCDTHMEETITKEFNDTVRLTKEEKAARIDLRYRRSEGKHVIIELKRYSASVTTGKLVDQVQKYYSALKKCLKEKNPREFEDRDPDIEIICVVGSKPRGENVTGTLRENNARLVTYDELIDDNQKRFARYLKEHREVTSRIREVVEALEK